MLVSFAVVFWFVIGLNMFAALGLSISFITFQLCELVYQAGR